MTTGERAGITWDEVRAEVVRLYGQERFEAALAHLARHEDDLGDVAGLVAFWRLCLLARLGRRADALAAMAGALDLGCWFPAAALADDDLAELAGDPGFAELAARHGASEAAAMAAARPRLRVVEPDGTLARPLLVALHAAGSNQAGAEAQWRAATTAGWRLALPQASRPNGFVPGTYRWEGAAQAAAELAAHLARLRPGPGPVVLAGFSQAAALALELAVAQAVAGLTVTAALAVAPTIAGPADVLPAGWPGAAGGRRPLRVHVVAGDQDDRVPAEAVDALVAQLAAGGVSASLERHPELGHGFPPGFATRLPALLAELAGPAAATAAASRPV